MRLFAAALLACSALAGCIAEERDRSDPYARTSERYYDPVCGHEVYSSSKWRTDYDGRVFYFHDRDCRDRFRERPHAYLDGRDHRRYYEAH